jgi:sugar lactone lactonase YvrE
MRNIPCKPSILTALVGALLVWPGSGRGDTAFVSYSPGSIERFDLATGADLGTFASGLGDPRGLAFDAAGNLFVANNVSGTIQKFAPDGSSSIFASGLTYPYGLAFDSAGNLYTTDGDKIRKFTTGGASSVFATGISWLGTPSAPRGLAFDAAGNLYMADEYYGCIDKFTPGGVGSILGYHPYLVGVAVDNAGNVYGSSLYASAVVRFTADGTKSFFAWTDLNNPAGMAFDTSGNLYVTDSVGVKIEKFTPAGAASVFITGQLFPFGIAIQIPEPTISAFAGLSLLSLVLRSACQRRPQPACGILVSPKHLTLS